MRLKGNFFSVFKLGRLDYFFGGILFIFCFFAFIHADIYSTGWNSLNYLFGHPLSFYENCKNIEGGGEIVAANYPPSIYLIFAAWLFPFKLLGVIKSPTYFNFYLVYWLKLLTTIMYVLTGIVFYKITQFYSRDHSWGKYVTWLWLTTPIALFSQFIFSQYDIFYVFLTLLGFLFFLDKRFFLASFIFGLSITFKYFPFFVFIPLLFFFEKKILKIFCCLAVFVVPAFITHALYHHSPAYVEGVLGFSAIGRVFYAALNNGAADIYYVFALFAVLSGIAYLLDSTQPRYKEIAAYLFLFSSILSFLFIFWHPQWVIFITPAIVLTTVISSPIEKINRLLFLDLIGMCFFIAFVSLAFPGNVDVSMLQTKLLHIPSIEAHIGDLVRIFGGFSKNIYLSVFIGYLVLQLISKYNKPWNTNIDNGYTYANVRHRYYIGLLIFILPALLMYSINYNRIYGDGTLQREVKTLKQLL